MTNPLPREPFRAPPWRTADGRRSDTRWPTLTQLNWLLPMSAQGEAQLAHGTMTEDYWNLGYRALIPLRLARALAPPPSADAQWREATSERRLLRRLETVRRREVTRQILPEWTQEDTLHLDLFGDPLSTSEESAPDPEIRGSPRDDFPTVTRQATCLQLAHTICAHVAWLRALYKQYLLTQFPRRNWPSDPHAHSADSSAPEGTTPPQE